MFVDYVVQDKDGAPICVALSMDFDVAMLNIRNWLSMPDGRATHAVIRQAIPPRLR